MSLRRKDIGLLIFSISLLVVFIAVLSAIPSNHKAETPGTRAQGDYQGATSCTGIGCHTNHYDSWILSPHASAWDTLNGSADKKDWCETCHTTGAEDTAHNGFDPATDQPDYLKNVQCESCHGPDPMSLADPSDAVDYSSSVCGTCHRSAQFDNQSRTYHPYYDEWLNSRHAQSLSAAGGAVATDPSCQGCHVAQVAIAENIEGGTIGRPITDPQPITCAVCHDPHGSPRQSQLRLDPGDLCATCHNPGSALPGEEIRHPQSNMREGDSGLEPGKVPSKDFMKDVLCSNCHLYSTGPPQNVTGHSFTFKPEACSSCHANNPQTFPLTVDQASTTVSAYQTSTFDSMQDVLENLFIADSMIEDAAGYGFDRSTIDLAESYFGDANYSYNFVLADKSLGAHNPQYALALLDFASNRTELVIEMLEPGEVVGRVVDSDDNPVAGIIVRRGGLDLAVSGADGMFSFMYASGTYNYNLVRGDNLVGTISDVTVKGGDTTLVGDVSISYSEPFDWTLVLILIITVLVVIVILLAGRSFLSKTGKEPSEDDEAKEEDSEEESVG